MSQNHIISDSCTRIRNALLVKKETVNVFYSNLLMDVFKLLKKGGYITDFRKTILRKGVGNITVYLKYNSFSKKSSITEISSVSKPGRRVYCKHNDIKSFYGGLGVFIFSTSKGVIFDYEAKNKKIGGEIICRVF